MHDACHPRACLKKRATLGVGRPVCEPRLTSQWNSGIYLVQTRPQRSRNWALWRPRRSLGFITVGESRIRVMDFPNSSLGLMVM